jgi:hypothetical protein
MLASLDCLSANNIQMSLFGKLYVLSFFSTDVLYAACVMPNRVMSLGYSPAYCAYRDRLEVNVSAIFDLDDRCHTCCAPAIGNNHVHI